MENIFLRIVNMSITASYCVVFICMARLLLRKCPKIFSYLLWCIVAIRLICPVGIESRFSLMPNVDLQDELRLDKDYDDKTIENMESLSESLGAPDLENLKLQEMKKFQKDLEAAESLAGNKAYQPMLQNLTYAMLKKAASQPAIAMPRAHGFLSTAASIWLIVTLLLFTYNIISYGRIKRKLKAKVVYGYQYKKIPVYLVDGLESPFVLGIQNAVIYLPKTLTEQERRHCLSHEYTHIRRRDYLIKQLAFLLACVYWFHPLIWLAFHLMAKDMEMSCDESALRNADLQERKAYAKALVQLSTKKRTYAGYTLSFGRNHISSRIRNVMNAKRKSLGITLMVIAFVMMSAIMLLTDQISQHFSLFHPFSHSEEGGKDMAKYVSERIDSTTREVLQRKKELQITTNLLQCIGNQELYAVAVLAAPDTENADSKFQIQVKAQPFDGSDNIIGILNPGDKVQILSIGSGITTKAELYGDLQDMSQREISMSIHYAMILFGDLDNDSPQKGYVRIENLSLDVPENTMDTYIYWTAEVWGSYFCTKNYALMSMLTAVDEVQFHEDIVTSEFFSGMSNPKLYPWKSFYISMPVSRDISENDETEVQLYYFEESSKPEMTVWRQDLTIETNMLNEITRIDELFNRGSVHYSQTKCCDKISSYEEFCDAYLMAEGEYCFRYFDYENEDFQFFSHIRNKNIFINPELSLRHYLHLEDGIVTEESENNGTYATIKCTFPDNISLTFPMCQKAGLWYIDWDKM